MHSGTADQRLLPPCETTFASLGSQDRATSRPGRPLDVVNVGESGNSFIYSSTFSYNLITLQTAAMALHFNDSHYVSCRDPDWRLDVCHEVVAVLLGKNGLEYNA